MNTRTQFEAQLEYKNIRRMRAEDKWLAKREKLEAKAKPFIGELNRYDEKADRCFTVYYVFPAGGKYKEGTYDQLVTYLARLGYIR